jgi:hypothetical protein
MRAAQLGFDLVRELPQVGDSLAEIPKFAVDCAGGSSGAQLDLDAEALERFHDDSFPALSPSLQLLSVPVRVRSAGGMDRGGGDACEKVLYHPLFCSTRGE